MADSLVLLGKQYDPIYGPALRNSGFEVLAVPANPDVDRRLSGHVDLSILKAGEDCLLCAPFLKNTTAVSVLQSRGYRILYTEKQQGSVYPQDAVLNACIFGEYLLWNPKTADSFISKLSAAKIEISCRQGYSRCCTCVVSDRAIITEDSGIARACRRAGVDVLEITPGYVILDGFPYGFIGGAGFLFHDVLYFTGTVREHPDWDQISDFCASHSVKPKCLTEAPLRDIGGFVILPR